MPLTQRLAAAGLSAAQALAIQGTVAQAVAAAGSTQGAATLLPADINYVTTGTANQGVVLPPMNAGDSMNVYNKTGVAILLYPPPGGSAIINSLGANAGYSIAAATPYCEVYCINPGVFVASQSA